MNRNKTLVTLLAATIMLTMIAFPLPTFAAAKKGPRTEELLINFYGSVESTFAALQAGEIDICGYEITAPLYEYAITDPNIQLGPVVDSGMYEFDIHSNITIRSYPDKMSPTSQVSFRQAIAHMVDKDTIVDEYCGGFAQRIDQPVAWPYKGWMNENYTEENYPYPYDRERAAELLDEDGFVQGTTANPYYDPEIPGSAEFIRTYPLCHEIWFNTGPIPEGMVAPYHILLPECVCEDPKYEFHVYAKLEGDTFYTDLSTPDQYIAVIQPDGCPPGEVRIKVIVNVNVAREPEDDNSYICVSYYTTTTGYGGDDLDPLHVCVRTDDLRRFYAGRDLYATMRALGIPVLPVEGDSPFLYDKVMGEMDYHIYTGGWSVGRFPPLTTNGLFSIDNYFPYGSNYNRPPITDNATCAAAPHPNYEANIKAAYYPETYAEAMKYHKEAMKYHVEYVVNIPLWSSRAFWAWSTDVLGVVNMDGFGPENGYTFMNAYKTDGSALRYGIKTAPNAMNIFYSSWYYDYQCLDRMNVYGGVDVPPYDLATDQAGYVQDWNVGTWNDSGEIKTKITQWFKKDSYSVEPVTGDVVANVNATDYIFSGMLTYALDDCWHWDAVADIHHWTIIDDYCVEIYYDTKSYWNTYLSWNPIVPRANWLRNPLTLEITETFVEGVNLTTPGPVSLSGKPVLFNSVTGASDWDWVKGDLYIYDNLTAATVVVVDYWYSGDCSGYTPAELAWEDIFCGGGMYYAYDYLPDVGGHIYLRRNPYYWMETPPLGEVDFVWKWGPRDGTRPAPDVPAGPRGGCYKIDIYDVVLACGAYGSTGTGVPSSNWNAGADLAAPGGKIDIYDIVTICGKYGTEYSCVP